MLESKELQQPKEERKKIHRNLPSHLKGRRSLLGIKQSARGSKRGEGGVSIETGKILRTPMGKIIISQQQEVWATLGTSYTPGPWRGTIKEKNERISSGISFAYGSS